jgi:hypothetical protein
MVDDCVEPMAMFDSLASVFTETGGSVNLICFRQTAHFGGRWGLT